MAGKKSAVLMPSKCKCGAHQEKGDVSHVINYVEKLQLSHIMKILGNKTLHVVKECLRHEDGSVSETFYLDLTQEQFDALTSYPYDAGSSDTLLTSIPQG